MANPRREDRIDRIPFSLDGKRTPAGHINLRANLTRVGVLLYRRADGSIKRELRPPDEVLKADSVASMANAVVTDLHPSEFVDAEKGELVKGFVRNAKEDGRFISGEIFVHDAELIRKIEAGERREISPGYTAVIDETPGIWDGEEYDSIQRDIVYNHAALLPAGAGRSGPEVSIRADCAIQIVDGDDTERPKMETTEIQLDGVTVTVAKNDAQHVTRLWAEKDGVIADTKQAVTDAKSEADKLRGELEVAKAEAATEKERADAATDPEKLQDAINARVDLVKHAQAIGGAEFVVDAKHTDHEVRVAAIKASGHKLAEGIEDRADSIVEGVFLAIQPTAAKAKGNIADAQAAIAGNKTKKEDAIDPELALYQANKKSGRMDYSIG